MSLGLWIEAADTLKLFGKMKEPSEGVQALMKALGFSLKWKEWVDKTAEEGGEVSAEKAKSAVAFLETTLAKCRIIVSQAKANKRERNAERRDAKSAGKALNSLIGMPFVAAPVLENNTEWKVYVKKDVDAMLKKAANLPMNGRVHWDQPSVGTRNVSATILTAILADLQRQFPEKAASLEKAFLALGGTLETPKVQWVDGKPHVELVPAIDSRVQRDSNLNRFLRKQGYYIFGGQSGAAKLAIRFPEKPGEFRDWHWLAKLIVGWFPQAGSASGYLGRLNAPLKMPVLRDLEVEFYNEDAPEERVCGSDGANHGWNVDHPIWSELVEMAGGTLPCIQGTYATTAVEGLTLADGTSVGVFAKGQWLPWRGGVDGPALRIGLKNCKGGAKLAIKAKLLKAGNRIHGSPEKEGHFQGCSSWFGVMSVKTNSKTQKLGAQWISHLAVTPKSVEIISQLAKEATSKFCKTTVEQRLEMLAAQDVDFAAQLDFARACGFGNKPGVIPDIRNRMLRHYKTKLYDTFGSVGLEGDIWTVVMTTRVEAGTVQFSPHAKRRYSAAGYNGEVVVWRSPHGHHQANVKFKVAPLAPELLVDPTKALDEMIAISGGKTSVNYSAITIYMNPGDAPRLNADDDGDDVAVSTDPRLIELVSIQRQEQGDALWSYEPLSHASGRSYLENPEDYAEQLQYRAQGQTGRFANALQDLRSLVHKGLHYVGILNAFAAGLQMSIDGLKKDATMALFSVVADLDKWVATHIEGRLATMAMPRAGGDNGTQSPEEFTEAAFTAYYDLLRNLFIQAAAMSLEDMGGGQKKGKLPAFGNKMEMASVYIGKDSTGKNQYANCSPEFADRYGERGYRPSPGRVDLASWRWCEGCDKDEVDPTKWVKTYEKDCGFSYWLRKQTGSDLPPTLLHAAHDAALEVFQIEGAASIGWFKQEVTRDFTSFAKFFRQLNTKLKGEDIFKAIPPTLGSAKMRGGSNQDGLTYLESRFQTIVKDYTASLKSAQKANDATGGSDDNGKAAVEAVATFRRWLSGSEPREEGGESRPLTVQELVFLGVYWEAGFISEVWQRAVPTANETEQQEAERLQREAKAREVRGLVGWSMVCNGSPIVEAMGVENKTCGVLASHDVVQYLLRVESSAESLDNWPVGPDGKKVSMKLALRNEALLREIFDSLDEYHWTATEGDIEQDKKGKRLVACPDCSIRAKMAIAGRLSDEAAFNRYRAVVKLAWESGVPRVCYSYARGKNAETRDFHNLALNKGKKLVAKPAHGGKWWYFQYEDAGKPANHGKMSALPPQESYDGGAMPPEPPIE